MPFFFSCVGTMAHPAAKMPWAYLSSQINRYSVKGTIYILYIIIIKYPCYSINCTIKGDLAAYHRRALCSGEEPSIRGLRGLGGLGFTGAGASISYFGMRECVPWGCQYFCLMKGHSCS